MPCLGHPAYQPDRSADYATALQRRADELGVQLPADDTGSDHPGPDGFNCHGVHLEPTTIRLGDRFDTSAEARIAPLPCGCYLFGYTCNVSYAGSSCGVSLFGQTYDTEADALEAALDRIALTLDSHRNAEYASTRSAAARLADLVDAARPSAAHQLALFA